MTKTCQAMTKIYLVIAWQWPPMTNVVTNYFIAVLLLAQLLTSYEALLGRRTLLLPRYLRRLAWESESESYCQWWIILLVVYAHEPFYHAANDDFDKNPNPSHIVDDYSIFFVSWRNTAITVTLTYCLLLLLQSSVSVLNSETASHFNNSRCWPSYFPYLSSPVSTVAVPHIQRNLPPPPCNTSSC